MCVKNKKSKEERIRLKNTIYVKTDSYKSKGCGSIAVGFVNYSTKGKRYYSYSEVERMITNNEFDKDEFHIDKMTGKYELRCSYLSYNLAFSVYCGRVLSEVPDEYMSILDYCKEIGVVSNEFKPVDGWFGTKWMKENKNGTFNIKYQLKERVQNSNYTFIEKICVGAVKKLAGSRVDKLVDGKHTSVERFKCKDVQFKEDTLTLAITGVPKEYIDSQIHMVINQLDLELWMLFNADNMWNNFFFSSLNMVNGMLQSHWLENTDNDSTSNIG